MKLRQPVRRRGGAWGITLLGIALGVSTLAYGTTMRSTSESVLFPLAELLVLFGLAGTVTYSGYWLGNSDIENAQLWRIATWVGLGIILAVTLMSWQLLAQARMGGVVRAPLATLVLTQAVGAVIGLLVGVYHVDALRTARRVRDAEARAQQARETSEQLEFLNHLLRHHLLNGVQVIQSYATLLTDHVDEEGRDHLATIQRRSDRMASLVENIRVLVQSLADDDRLEPQRLDVAIDSELAVLDRSYESATFRVVDHDGSAVVRADALLPTVFENLLRNAVEHNAAPDPVVEVSVRTTDDRAVVSISDDGPGIDPGIEEKFLDGGGVCDSLAEEGTGLYIVDRLVDSYGGDLTVENGDGACFVVRLPLATAGEKPQTTT